MSDKGRDSLHEQALRSVELLIIVSIRETHSRYVVTIGANHRRFCGGEPLIHADVYLNPVQSRSPTHAVYCIPQKSTSTFLIVPS